MVYCVLMIYEVYLAGPEVFASDAKEIGEELKQICAKNGLKGLFPLDAELGPKADPKAIFEANVALIRQAKGVIANMTPFRGPSTDAGRSALLTALESLWWPIPGTSISMPKRFGFWVSRTGCSLRISA